VNHVDTGCFKIWDLHFMYSRSKHTNNLNQI